MQYTSPSHWVTLFIQLFLLFFITKIIAHMRSMKTFIKSLCHYNDKTILSSLPLLVAESKGRTDRRKTNDWAKGMAIKLKKREREKREEEREDGNAARNCGTNKVRRYEKRAQTQYLRTEPSDRSRFDFEGGNRFPIARGVVLQRLGCSLTTQHPR